MVTHRLAKPSIIRTWLQFLAIPAYASNFEENGYEDLETIKLICEEDLLEIGIEDAHHRQIILASVKILKEQGAAWVYLLLASQEQQLEKKKEKEEEEEEEEEEKEKFPMCESIGHRPLWDCFPAPPSTLTTTNLGRAWVPVTI